MTTQDHIRELAAQGATDLIRNMYLKTPTDRLAISPELFREMMTDTDKLRVYLELSQYGALEDTSSPDYIECGGLQWALQNAGTDAENPNGKLYTFNEALTLENDLWRGPTHEEQEMFIDRTYHGFDKERKVEIFVDRETGVKLELPAVGLRADSSGKLCGAGTRGRYWSSTQYDSSYAHNMYFNSSSVSPSTNYDKRIGLSVRLVRR